MRDKNKINLLILSNPKSVKKLKIIIYIVFNIFYHLP
jgi:hypothetical protein